MKNKKGITIGRVLLYLLFGVVFLSIIWVLVLTYREIAKNPNKTPKIECDNNIRYQYSNQYDYSAADYITSIWSTWSRNSSWAEQDYNPFSVNANYNETSKPMYWCGSGTLTKDNAYHPSMSINDNVVQIGNSIYSYGQYYYNNLYNPQTLILNAQSSFIFYQCNIPVSLFSGNITGAYSNVDTDYNCIIWYVTDLDYNENTDTITGYHKFRFRWGSNFDLAHNLDSSVLSASRVLYFGFGLFQNYTLNDKAFINNPNFRNDFYSSINNSVGMRSIYINFDVHYGNQDYQSGYDDGYLAGKNDVDTALENINQQLSQQIQELNTTISDLNSRVNSQSTIITQLQDEINNSSNFKGLFFTMADVPFKTVSNVLGFEVLGVNLFQFFTGILTALGMIWLIKKIL